MWVGEGLICLLVFVIVCRVGDIVFKGFVGLLCECGVFVVVRGKLLGSVYIWLWW